MKRYTVILSKEEREKLLKITTSGKHQSQQVINALILLNTDEGEYQEILKINEGKTGKNW